MFDKKVCPFSAELLFSCFAVLLPEINLRIKKKPGKHGSKAARPIVTVLFYSRYLVAFDFECLVREFDERSVILR